MRTPRSTSIRIGLVAAESARLAEAMSLVLPGPAGLPGRSPTECDGAAVFAPLPGRLRRAEVAKQGRIARDCRHPEVDHCSEDLHVALRLQCRRPITAELSAAARPCHEPGDDRMERPLVRLERIGAGGSRSNRHPRSGSGTPGRRGVVAERVEVALIRLNAVEVLVHHGQ